MQLPRRRVLLSVLATLVLSYHATTTPAAATVATCAPKTCGNITLSYPFWVTDAAQPSTPCGPPAFQVDCVAGGRASLSRSFRGGYKLLRVSYADRTVVVANDNVQTNASGCPVPTIDVSASLSLAPFSASAAANRAVAGRCSYAVVPVVGSLSPGGSAGAEYPRLLREGYVLEWRASAGDCGACSASGGQCGYDSNADAFACVCADGSSHPARCISLSITFGLLLACLVTALKFHRRIRSFSYSTIMDRKTIRADNANVEKLLKKYGSLAPRRYRYCELKKITNSFKFKLGEGGYGTVYSGTLPGDHRKVAVKFLHHSGPKGEEFLNEVISIGRTSHVNIVSLLGFCLEGSKRALVYEQMPNGSLDKYIYSAPSSTTPAPVKSLGWETLQEIALGVARGLEYLHEGCNTRIIHFDVKPHNVLLDEGFRPKVADFGMAKLCDPKESILTMADARGTVGFIAPEVFSRGFGVVSAKSDVYSYGMLLLEMVGGRSNVKAFAAEKEADLFFPLWIYDYMGETIARKMAMVGLWCIQTVPANRPSMSRVLEMLERSIHELPMPPRPYHPSSPSFSPSMSHSLPSSYPSSTSGFTQRSRPLTPESTV
ncbi:LEAF RUST 10 DISEASE-RESISTANCE LOCUS RECEPTOR-LIKE PROTEIN KINASE-like 2.1 [Lolium rigidum]|uniref:LEAF RUST 10 DISEASE-RESISTANCE LOCUS RECEPTOR-LIKE PROTEIN KINASE-like 2.1 n=1 Tax=Lolium rigidum TaxID=89674 RepID=UPI001F5C4A50|nr:LEAF RUST 10 DISEASE-RESISTANCE LOCUS RECEPTOR-LIKE PROTEIN KINASE-like 2.1 [Lolium rigidum]